MKSLIPLLVLSLMGVAEGVLQSRPNGQIDSELTLLPPLIRFGLGMMGECDAAPVVGACECHSPFARAGFVGGDRIVSVDGTMVRTVDDVRKALSLARPKRSIVFVILPALRFEGSGPKKVRVEFPAGWWQLGSKKK